MGPGLCLIGHPRLRARGLEGCLSGREWGHRLLAPDRAHPERQRPAHPEGSSRSRRMARTSRGSPPATMTIRGSRRTESGSSSPAARGKRGLYRIKADGSGLKRLTTDPSDDNAAFSPDGEKIVFTRGELGPVKRGMAPAGPDIWVMRADGSHEHALTSNPAADDYPSFSPNGKRIAFDSERSGNFDIFEMRADGSTSTRSPPAGGTSTTPTTHPTASRSRTPSRLARTTTCSRWTPTGPTSTG